MIRLEARGTVLELTPEVGGGVAALRRNGMDVLRPASAADLAAGLPLGLAAYPLVPFAGRIAQGRFEFAGRTVTLPAGMPGEAHAIHGQGWLSSWEVLEHAPRDVTLVLEHAAGDWPWRYRATQRFRLQQQHLRVDLSLQNLDSTPMPGGLGWHPFFVAPPGTALRADVTAIWRRGPDGLPAAPLAPGPAEDLRRWRPVAELDLDDVFTVGPGPAEIRWPAGGVRLAGRPAAFLVVYIPPGRSWFCVEPLSHVPNGINLPATPATGWRVLQPRALQALRVNFELLPAR